MSIPRSSGIYQILCVTTGKIYIGSAINLRQRKADHIRKLRDNRHVNPHLQSAWNKYGEAAFEFSVLELVMFPEYLIEREQVWLDVFQCYNSDEGFNIYPTAGSPLGMKYPEGSRDYLRDLKAQSIEGYIDPAGNLTTIYNLWDFCKQNGLKHSAMYRLANGQGRTKSHKGWTHRDHPYQGRAQTWDGFIDPTGASVPTFVNLSAFCRLHGLSEVHMRSVHLGIRPHHRGWTCKRDDDDV